ncbi:MAG: glycogen/starch synthase [Desulfobacterales bacterium]
MAGPSTNPRILIVTPEVTYLPQGMGNLSNYLSVKAGGVADVSATLIRTLFEQDADVHVAIPDYRTIFRQKLPPIIRREFDAIRSGLPEDRIHLAKDRSFFYLDNVSYGDGLENTKISLNFQRDIINNIVPRVQPDLIHCNDWMTGLIPAMARQLGIPCLFTIHNIYTEKCPLSHIEDVGIDAACFWQNLLYEHYPLSYEKSRDSNPVDFLASGVFAAHFVNTVSPTFLMEMIEGRHNWMNINLQQELYNKREAGCAVGILNAPDPSFNPVNDKALFRKFSAKEHHPAKQYNKLFLQEKLGLIMDSRAPIFFWPSRLDTIQKGCHLLAEILYDVVCSYRDQNLEIVFVANGEFKKHFTDIVASHQINNRVAVCDFEERLSRLAYGASDFVLMPSRFEPCGLPQMIGPLYGALPVAYNTGGLHDTVIHMDVDSNTGNGFLFKNYDTNGLFWAIKEAMRFYNLSRELKSQQIERVMIQSAASFNHSIMASQYIELYEKMLDRPLFK